MAGPSTARGSRSRSGQRASVSGGNVGLRRRRSSAASGASSKKDASRLLKSTLAEEERKQLAAWLDKKHKELDTQLKKMGVPSAARAEGLLSSGGKRQHDAGASGVDDDIMMILGRRLQQGPRPVHSHHMEFVLDEEDGFEDGPNSVARSSPPPSYRHGSPLRDDGSYSSTSPERRRGSAEPLPLSSRLAQAAQAHQYSSRQVLELFFPLWHHGDRQRDGPALLPLEQVLDVLHVDLGVRVSRAEARELEREADRDVQGGRVDVRQLLEQAGLWPNDDNSDRPEAHRLHWAMRVQQPSKSAGPRPDPDRARRRLKERQAAAAVQIQRVVRGRLARRDVGTLRFNKVTARHRQAAHERLYEQSGPKKARQPASSSKEDRAVAPRLAAFELEDGRKGGKKGEEGNKNKGTRAAAALKEAAPHHRQQQEEEDLDALMEHLLSAGPRGERPGSPVVELLPFPLASSPARREDGPLSPPPQHEGANHDPGHLLSSRTEGAGQLPYPQALVTAVTKGGEAAFYRLAAILRSGGAAFLPYPRVRMALTEAGYGLSEAEARDFLLGMGSDAQGRIEAAEVLQALTDLLQDLTFTSAARSSARHRSPPARGLHSPSRPGSYMRASGMVTLDGHRSPSPGQGRRRRRDRSESPQLSAAEREVLSQLLRHGGGGKLSSKRLLAPFLERDPFQDGYLSLLDFASALDSLGLELETDELAELAFKYRCPEELMAEEEGEEAGGRLGVDYAPFVRVIVEAAKGGGHRRRRRGRSEDSSGSGSADREGSSEDDEEKEASGSEESDTWHHHRSARRGKRGGVLRDFLSEEEEDESRHGEVIKSMKELFYGQDDKRKWLRMLRLTLAKVDPSGRGSVDRKTLAKVLKAGQLAVGEKDLAELAAFLATRDDGQLAYPRLLRVWDAVLDCPKEAAHDLMARLLDGVSSKATPGTRLRWVRRLRRLLTDADKYRTGVLESDQVVRLLQRAGDAEAGGGLALSTSQLKALAQAFLTDDMEGVAYRPLLRTLAQHAGRWYELDPDAASRLLTAFPKMSPPTRFICQLRRTMRGLDIAAEGRLDVDDVDYALCKKARLRLDEREVAALLECLSPDGSGKVYYEDLLGFFELYQLAWHELVDDVAADLSRQLFKDGGAAGRAGWKRFSLLRSRLYDRDRAKAGVVSSKALREALEGVGVALRPDDFMRLVEALEVDKALQGQGDEGGSGGGVRYRELLRHLLELNGEAREEVTETFIRLVRKQLAEQQSGIKQGLAVISSGCSEADADRTGRLSIESFRRQLQRAGVRVELEDVGQLADFCDFYGDGRVAYPAILEQVLAGHALPSAALGQGEGRAGRSKRRRGGGGGSSAAKDWSWTRSSAIAALRSELQQQLGADKAARERAVRAAFREFDTQDEGVVAVEDLADVFGRLMAAAPNGSLSPAEVRDLASELYAQSQGHAGPGGGRKCILYEEVITALSLSDKDFKTRYPQPLVRRPGQQLLYERVLERRKNVVIGHHTPSKDQQQAEAGTGAGKGGPSEVFLAACLKIDRKKTGLVSVVEARKLAGQAGLKPEAPLNLRTLLDKHTVGGNRVQYQRMVDELLGKRTATNSRRGSAQQQANKPVTAPLPPRVARLVKSLGELREDDVHLGTLARTLTKCGFQGTAEEVSGLTKDLLAVGARSIKRAALVEHVREHGTARLLPPSRAAKGVDKGDPHQDDDDDELLMPGVGHRPGTRGRAAAF